MNDNRQKKSIRPWLHMVAVILMTVLFSGCSMKSRQAAVPSPVEESWAVRHLKPVKIELMPNMSYEMYKEFLNKIDNALEGASDSLFEYVENVPVYADLYSPGCSWYCGGYPDSVWASSSLPPQGHNTYDGRHAHDFNHTTAWIVGAAKGGKGDALYYLFKADCPRITRVKIINGYAKTEKAWRENNRVKQLMMCVDNHPYAILDLEDSRSCQTFDVDTLGYADRQGLYAMTAEERLRLPDWTLKFEILNVYPGNKYDDTAITELYFDGIDVH